MDNCNCKPKNYNFSMGCCQPVLAPIENYYTKYQVDQMLEEIESAITSGCCITPEEVDEKIEEAISGISPDLSDYYTKEEVDELIPEVPSLSGYATEQWVLDKHYITGVDLSDYVTKEELPDLTVYATKNWVLNQNFITNSEFIQYITNLQQQIDSLKQQISGCCTSTGETLTRWITMTGVNDYTCSGTTKMTKEKEQTSSDGGNTWTDTGNYRAGSTVLEVNSEDCGFIVPFKVKGTNQIVSITGSVQIDCDSSTVITKDEIKNNFRSASFVTSIQFGSCIDTIGEQALLQAASLSGTVDIPSNITTIEYQAFAGCNASAYTLHEGLVTIGIGAFSYNDITSINIPNSVTDIGHSAFSYCPALTGVTIGSGVTHIGHGAFEASKKEDVKIISMIINATTPPTLDSGEAGTTFYGYYTIYVPAASVNAYKSAWSQYASRIQAIS